VVEVIGWIGALFLAVCAAPQAYKSYVEKKTEGVSITFLSLWYLGEVLTLIYICFTSVQIPLVINYVFNILCLTVIIYYWRKDDKR
jgi:uncharacterized protein with PQ loop repeat